MKVPTALRQKAASRSWRSVVVPFAVLLGYVLFFFMAYPIIGGAVSAVCILPAVAAGWYLGRWYGGLFSLLVLATVSVLFGTLGTEALTVEQVVQRVVPMSLSTLITGVFVGWASDSNRRALAQTRLLKAEVEARAEIEANLVKVQEQIDDTAREILTTARQQERGAMAQSGAVEETRAVMESLVGSSRQIVQVSEAVMSNAQRSLANHERVMDRIRTLTGQLERITELLESIRAIADKSDLLALNAALEGVRAGEAGRGFTLVAANIQRLAESVIVAVGDIQELADDIDRSTTSSVLATEEGEKLAEEAVGSAQQISLTAKQQQGGSEQAMGAIQDIAEVAKQTATGAALVLASTEKLTALAGSLRELTKALQERMGSS